MSIVFNLLTSSKKLLQNDNNTKYILCYVYYTFKDSAGALCNNS